MPDLTIIPCHMCSSNVEWHKEVPGSKGAKYTVTFDRHSHREESQYGYSCSCPAYKFNPTKHCKHIEAVIASGDRCGWNDQFDHGEAVGGKCPECGADTVVIQIGV